MKYIILMLFIIITILLAHGFIGVMVGVPFTTPNPKRKYRMYQLELYTGCTMLFILAGLVKLLGY